MTDDEARRIMYRAKSQAFRAGYGNLSEDFSQTCLLTFLENPKRKSSFPQLWIDFLRHTYGNSRTKKGKAGNVWHVTIKANHAHVPCYEDLINEYYLVKEYAVLFKGKTLDLFMKLFTEDITQEQLSRDLGVCPAAISIYKRKMIRRIQEYEKTRVVPVIGLLNRP